MTRINYKTGFICDAVASIIRNEINSLQNEDSSNNTAQIRKIEGLLEYISCFDVEMPFKVNAIHKKVPSQLAVIHNIISRGLPTRVPLIVEEKFAEIGLVSPNKSEFEFDFSQSPQNINFNLVFELLHILEPHLEINKNRYEGELGSNFEWQWLNSLAQGFPFITQILEPQKEFFGAEKTVDFAYTSPYSLDDEKVEETQKRVRGFFIEVDGPHHKQLDYRIYDKYRDDIADKAKFTTFRQTSIFKKIDDKTPLIKIFNKASYQIYKKNFYRKIEDYLAAYSLIFIPLGVARIQKTIIEYFINCPASLEQDSLTVAIIERDLPCGALAIKALESFLKNINALSAENNKLKFPKLILTIFPNEKWVIDKRLHCKLPCGNESDFPANKFDIIIDHSILRRSKIYKEKTFIHENAIKIRSAHFSDKDFGYSRRVYCSDLINYKKLVRKKEDGSFEPIKKYLANIEFFLQNVFRKKSYREGQLPIISRALRQKPVIGLLPTGGGKSLTFQLSAFLQPGLCLVVDPIKSLMEDQVRVLRENWIDCCDYINSSLNRVQKQQKLVDLQYGENLFMFIAPERFVMEEFRSITKNIDASPFNLAFSFCVIDEVHCVSEWGHDFRATYLMLGKNAQAFTKTKSGKKVTLVGLTATASYDVLADVERELDIEHEDIANALVAIENTIRPELFFRVIDVSGKNRIEALNNDFTSIGQKLQKLNTPDLLEESQKHHFDEFETKDFSKDTESGKVFQFNDKYLIPENLAKQTQNDFYNIIFCPVKGENEKNPHRFGVQRVYKNLKSDSKGFFYSVDAFKGGVDLKEKEKLIQKNFQDFIFDRLKHIVCTKAFGMGIDKKDVRATYHFVYSSSLESFVQEAGRAGRDRKIAEAVVLTSLDVEYSLSHECLLKTLPSDDLHNPISNIWHRKAIRKIIKKSFSIELALKNEIDTTIDILPHTSDTLKTTLKNRLKSFIISEKIDRGIHHFFYNGAFKGVITEKSQLYNLFKYKEFTFQSNIKTIQDQYNASKESNYIFKYWEGGLHKRIYVSTEFTEIGHFDLITGDIAPNDKDDSDILVQVKSFIFDKIKDIPPKALKEYFQIKSNADIPEQKTLVETFNNCSEDRFDFMIASSKIYPKIYEELCKLLDVNPFDTISPPKFLASYESRMKIAYKNAADFHDFLLRIEEIGGKISPIKIKLNERQLKFKFNVNRENKPNNDTGRLIYRMHSMGFLEDYMIDYQKNNLFKCTFRKYETIEEYFKHIDKYFRRYLSENGAIRKMEELKKKCNKPTVIDNILECLYFLSEFSYEEIASKRKDATDEIEKMMRKSIVNEKFKSNSFEQNKFIKEEIYFYFNAKYARRGIQIDNKPYSLLDDYEKMRDGNIEVKNQLLNKYLEVVEKYGTAQNNYKHLIGSCKKILKTLVTSDLDKEWVLRLLKAFALYSVNNESYVSEANAELELGFDNLYKEEILHPNNFDLIEPIFIEYFKQLEKSIDQKNSSFKSIRAIRLNLLMKMQALKIQDILNLTKKIKTKSYANV